MASSSSASAEAVTRALLARAHSPSSVDRLYAEKIQHRPLRLRANSPTPAANARDARRKARQQKEKERRKILKPKPLSARERRRLGLYRLPRPHGTKYALFEPLHELWLGYVREVLGNDMFANISSSNGNGSGNGNGNGGPAAATKLASADFHGAEVEVVRSGCPSRVGIRGIVVKDAKFVLEIVTPKNTLKIVPKEGTIFRVEVPVTDSAPAAAGDIKKGDELDGEAGKQRQKEKVGEKEKLVFEIHGDQFRYRSADRANKKFKAHFLPNL